MLAQLGYQDLRAALDELNDDPAATRLHLALTGKDPDSAANDIAYEKGYSFLRLIEETAGREKWDSFLRDYFSKFAFQTMNSEKFIGYLRETLIKDDAGLEEKLQIDEWVYLPGLPDNCPKPLPRAFEQVEAQVKAWVAGESPAARLQTNGWTTHQWLHFLKKLPESMTRPQMAELDAAFKFTNTGNAEILNEWLLRAIRNRYDAAFPALERFLTGMGRRKFLKPLYTELARTPEGLDRARRIYEKARPTYHPVSYSTIDEILKTAAAK
jgi:hypothetical protein